MVGTISYSDGTMQVLVVPWGGCRCGGILDLDSTYAAYYKLRIIWQHYYLVAVQLKDRINIINVGQNEFQIVQLSARSQVSRTFPIRASRQRNTSPPLHYVECLLILRLVSLLNEFSRDEGAAHLILLAKFISTACAYYRYPRVTPKK